LVTFSQSYARKHKWLFFSEHSVDLGPTSDICTLLHLPLEKYLGNQHMKVVIK